MDATLRGRRVEASRRPARVLHRLELLAVSLSETPMRALLVVLGVNLALGALFVAIGYWLIGDQAELFRELEPGTWLSFAELSFVAVIARTIHLRVAHGRGWRRLDNFWALSAAVFCVFAFDEITQATVFLGEALEHSGISRPHQWRDIDAFLLTVLFLAAAGLLLRQVDELLRHKRAVLVLAVGVALGAVSQGLDSLLRSTPWEFVTEESIKLAAEPFFIAGYLLALRDVLRRPPAGTGRGRLGGGERRPDRA
jgi:hypothetical protein